MPPGTYSVGFTLPAGYFFTLRDLGGNDALDSDAGPTGRTIQFVLEAGETDLTWDAGLVLQNPLLAVIGTVEAFTRDGQTVVRWETVESWGTAGFWLERKVDGEWVRISQELIPFPLFGVAPIIYEEVDPGAVSGATYVYRLVEMENDGDLLTYGPYALTVDGPGRTYQDWAAEHFTAEELTDPAISGEEADPDGDGRSNWEEFLADTDPNQAEPLLAIRDVRRVDGGFQIEWNAEAGRSYKIAVADSLSESFLPLADVHAPSSVNGTATLSVDFSGRQKYFQVIQLNTGSPE